MTARVLLNPGVVQSVVSEPAMAAFVAAKAKEGAEAAASMVPVRSGYLKRSYKATGPRLVGSRVVATAYTISAFGHWWEWGTVRQTALAPLRRGAERAGAIVKVRSR